MVRTCSGFMPRRSRFDGVTFIRVGHAQDRRFNPGHEYVFFLHFTACALLSSALPNFWPHRERPSYNVTSSILASSARSRAPSLLRRASCGARAHRARHNHPRAIEMTARAGFTARTSARSSCCAAAAAVRSLLACPARVLRTSLRHAVEQARRHRPRAACI